MQNVDPEEIKKFSKLAANWWDPEGEFKPLHDINPIRFNYIDKITSVRGKKVLDVGCGGGLLCEAMAKSGGIVKGIDLSEKAIKVAQIHLLESKLDVDYDVTSAEELSEIEANRYDIVTCLEMLEHTPNPASTVNACSKLLKEGGWAVFSTINRNLKAYLFAILGAEYILKMLPIGTHHYEKLLRPSEVANFCLRAGLEVDDFMGMTYNPITKKYTLKRDTSVNYLVVARKRS